MQVEDGIKKTRGIPAFIAKVMEGKGKKIQQVRSINVEKQNWDFRLIILKC